MATNTGNNPNIIRGKSKPDIEAIIAHTRLSLLTKLRDEVMGLVIQNNQADGEFDVGQNFAYGKVLAIIANLEKAGE